MTEKSRRYRSDFAKMDATPAEPDEEIPELTLEMLDSGVVHIGPVIVAGPRKPGRPLGSGKKQSVHIMLDKDLVARFRKSGKGWQTRINQALRMYVELSTRRMTFTELYDAFTGPTLAERAKAAAKARKVRGKRAG